MPIHMIPNNSQLLNEKFIDIVIGEVVNKKNFEKSETELESHYNIEELNFPQKYDSIQPIIITFDDINEKEINDPLLRSS